MREKHDNLFFTHPNGQVTHYNLELALNENKSPEVVVLRHSELNKGPSIQSIELQVSMGMSGDGKTPHAIYSEREHGRYESVAFEQRGKDPSGEPLYLKDHSTKGQYLDENQIQEALELPEKKRQLALEVEKNKKDFDQGAVKGDRAQISEDELKAFKEEVDKRPVETSTGFAAQATETESPKVSQEELQSLQQQVEQKNNKEH